MNKDEYIEQLEKDNVELLGGALDEIIDKIDMKITLATKPLNDEIMDLKIRIETFEETYNTNIDQESIRIDNVIREFNNIRKVKI